MEKVTDFILLDTKININGNCSMELKKKKKKSFLLGKKAMTNLDSMLKSRDITLSTKFHLAKTMVFPVVMYGCELEHKES